MSHSKKTILKTIFTFALIIGSVGYVSTIMTHSKSRAALETVETTTAQMSDWTEDKTDVARKKWQQVGLEEKVLKVQNKTHPAGNKLKTMIKTKTAPGLKLFSWGERHMSLPAILLIFVFIGVFFGMGMSGANSRLGGRH